MNRRNHTQREDKQQRGLLGRSPAIFPDSQVSASADMKWYKTLVGWKVRLEIVGIIFAILYAVVTYFQWRDAQNNFRTDERAWLLVQGTGFRVNNGSPTAIVIIGNTGHTPAFHVFVHECSEVRETEPTKDQSYDPNACKDRQNGVLGPNVTTTMVLSDLEHPMNEEEAEAFSSGKVRLYFWGSVEYKTFDDQTPKRSTFCLMTETVPNPRSAPPSNIPAEQLAPCVTDVEKAT